MESTKELAESADLSYSVTVSEYKYRRIPVCAGCGASLGSDFLDAKVKKKKDNLENNKCPECKQLKKTLDTKTIVLGVCVFAFAVAMAAITGTATSWFGWGSDSVLWAYQLLHAMFALPVIILLGFLLKAPPLHSPSARYKPFVMFVQADTNIARRTDPKASVYSFSNEDFADAFAGAFDGVKTQNKGPMAKNNQKLILASDNYVIMAVMAVAPIIVILTVVWQLVIRHLLGY